MLQDSPVTATLPMTDLQKTKDFYENKLGLKLSDKQMGGDMFLFDAGKGSKIFLYKRGPSKAEHTQAVFKVDNIESEIDELVQKGVVFEQYKFLKTNEKGISTDGSTKSAWFKDPDGNILALVQVEE